jgi:hypothetical protein
MSNVAPQPIVISGLTDTSIIIAQRQRSLQDSVHDNSSCFNHPIIQKLYDPVKPKGDEDSFIRDYSQEGYINNLNERTEKSVRGFFTTGMECLVNKTPLYFKNSSDTSLTFVYDQGPHPINYFQNALNGMFISDAVDTAPKLTNPSQRPVLFTTPQNVIVVPGSYIGFNEDIVQSVVFSGFSSVTDKVQCKIIIRARLNDQSLYRWFDLSQNFEENNTGLIGYTLLNDALTNAKFKRSNDKNTGFFIGNANARKILEKPTDQVKPIVALCIVVAKLLGDFSSALASSPTIKKTYTDGRKMYGNQELISIPEMIIHVSGDRLCSFEALRQDADTIKTSPRNTDGIIPIKYTPGVNSDVPIDYKQRFDTIHTEIIQRFKDLLIDVNAFSIYKYKVDGNVVSDQNKEKLDFYTKTLSSKITIAMGIIENHIETITGDDRTKYETLYREKIRLMPQAPLISTPIKDGYRKNLSTKFHIYKLSSYQKLTINLRDDVNKIMKSNTGGKRKLRSKRLRRTLRRLRGGQKPTKERALADFDDLRYSIRERMFNFASSTNTIDYDSNQPDFLIEKLTYISKLQYRISIDNFIELVKENKHEVTDQNEIQWAAKQVEGSVLGKRPSVIYVADYDEEFMKEVEEAINEMHYQIKQNTEDADYIALIESIPYEIVDYIPPPTDATMSDNVVSDSNTVSEDETSTSANIKEKVPSTPSSRASTPNSEPQTLPINRSVPTSDTEFSQSIGSELNSDTEYSQPIRRSHIDGGRKRKTYRRIRLF